jgi:hypothetical protein
MIVNWIYFTAVALFAALFAYGTWRELRNERRRLDAQIEAEILQGMAELDDYLRQRYQP